MKGNNEIPHGRKWVTALKVLFWTVLTVCLAVAGTVLYTLRMLTPSRLTPLVEQIANRTLNAYVGVDTVELSFRGSYPFIDLDMSGVTILSKDIADLPADRHGQLPSWADTLLTIDHLHGGINPFRLYSHIIDLHDLQISGPQVNVLIVDSVLNNFSIFPDRHSSSGKFDGVPDIRLNRFRLVDPRQIRYADLVQQNDIILDIRDASVTNASDKDVYLPQYRVRFASEIASPIFSLVGHKSFDVGFDGIVDWQHEHPYEVRLKDFDFSLYRLSGRLNLSLDFLDNMTVKKFDLKINPITINDILGVMPRAYAEEKDIPRRLDTDAAVAARVTLLRPYLLGSLSLPHADVNVEVADCYLNYDRLRLERLALSLGIYLRGGTPNDVVFEVRSLKMEGPHASLDINGSLTEIMLDPEIKAQLKGTADMAVLPKSVTDRLQAAVSGRLKLDAGMRARASMFATEKLHEIRIKGDAEIDRFYWLAYDTLSFYKVPHARLKFGTNEASPAGEDSLLRLTLDVDTARMLISGLDFKMGRVRLAAGANHAAAGADATILPPVNASLKVGSFSLFTISDTLGAMISNIDGPITLRRRKSNPKLPRISIDMGLGRLSSGNNSARVMFADGHLKCDMSLLPAKAKKDTAKHKVKRRLKPINPSMAPEKVIAAARAIRARHHNPYPRVHPVMTADGTEVIDWGTSKMLRGLLLNWKLRGTLHTGTGRLFATSFPVRNRIRNLDVDFSNDTILLTNVEMKSGRSDFLMSGRISNVKHGLTADEGPSPIKVNFELLSDSIDINEIASAFLREEAPRDTQDHGKKTRSPILVPTNIDARLNISAKNLNYSDMALRNFAGEVLMYDGGINIHDIKASSEAGSIALDALYSAPTIADMNFGIGMELGSFNVRNFLRMVPAVDSLMPLMRDLGGVVNANVATTSKIGKDMSVDLASMRAAVRIEGDSIVFLSKEMYDKVAKWLLFKRHEENMVKHVAVEMVVDEGMLRIYPFIFDFNRYKLGIQGYTDINRMFHYHVAVLKSPIPFKFGINISGPYDHLKIRFGGAHFDQMKVEQQLPVVAGMRLDLIDQIQEVFRRGVRNSEFAKIAINDMPIAGDIDLDRDTITAADSLYLMREGFIPQ